MRICEIVSLSWYFYLHILKNCRALYKHHTKPCSFKMRIIVMFAFACYLASSIQLDMWLKVLSFNSINLHRKSQILYSNRLFKALADDERRGDLLHLALTPSREGTKIESLRSSFEMGGMRKTTLALKPKVRTWGLKPSTFRTLWIDIRRNILWLGRVLDFSSCWIALRQQKAQQTRKKVKNQSRWIWIWSDRILLPVLAFQNKFWGEL